MEENKLKSNNDSTEREAESHNTDAIKVSLFNVYASVVNSERQAIWQRYSAMLIANSVVFSFAFQQQSSPHSFENLIWSSMGLLLCLLWWRLTVDGWKFYDIYCKHAAKFKWPAIDENVNIFEAQYGEYENVGGDRIKWAAISVIALFVFGYIFLFLHYFIVI